MANNVLEYGKVQLDIETMDSFFENMKKRLYCSGNYTGCEDDAALDILDDIVVNEMTTRYGEAAVTAVTAVTAYCSIKAPTVL